MQRGFPNQKQRDYGNRNDQSHTLVSLLRKVTEIVRRLLKSGNFTDNRGRSFAIVTSQLFVADCRNAPIKLGELDGELLMVGTGLVLKETKR